MAQIAISFAGNIPEFPTAFEAVHEEYARRKGAVILGDKSPNYYDQLLQLVKDFPGARFIIVWRHPAETIGAAIRAAATGSVRKRATPLRFLLGSLVLKHQCDGLLAVGTAVHQVQYNDLVSDTAAVMRSVCQFLQLPYDAGLSTLEGDRSAVYKGKHQSLLRGDVIVSAPRPDLIDPACVQKSTTTTQPSGAGPSPQSTQSFPLAQDRSLRECALIGLHYRRYRALDACVRLAFCFLPIPLLRLYRKAKA
jgi:hypothetical protein